MESEVNLFTVESVIRGYVPDLRGGVVKCKGDLEVLVCRRHTRNRHDLLSLLHIKARQ